MCPLSQKSRSRRDLQAYLKLQQVIRVAAGDIHVSVVERVRPHVHGILVYHRPHHLQLFAFLEFLRDSVDFGFIDNISQEAHKPTRLFVTD